MTVMSEVSLETIHKILESLVSEKQIYLLVDLIQELFDFILKNNFSCYHCR